MKRKLWVRWGRREEDLVYGWPAQKADGHLLYHILRPGNEKGLLAELEARGYDLTTLRFEVALKD